MGRVLGLPIQFSDRLSLQTQELVHEMVDHNERGVALETKVDVLGCEGTAVSDQERRDALALASAMGMTDGFVESALAKCPRQG